MKKLSNENTANTPRKIPHKQPSITILPAWVFPGIQEQRLDRLPQEQSLRSH